MKQEQIEALISRGEFPETTEDRELIETHISWVVLCDQFVYKIKKPMKYSFLDFSTPELRKYFCERELILNRRMSDDLYLEVLPVVEFNGTFGIGGKKGRVVDYALKMRKLDPQRQMDVLVSDNRVSEEDIENLARRIAEFHQSAQIIDGKNVLHVQELFEDLNSVKAFLSEHLGIFSGKQIERAIDISNAFLKKNEELMLGRLESGFYRDCHGDLHTRNIFLLPYPQPFDCLEFNSDLREMDVLDEVAFLCMDLDSLHREDLSVLFIKWYNRFFPAIRADQEERLFRYYKGYRANVRAKVNALRAKSATDDPSRTTALDEVKRYLSMMSKYLDTLHT